MVDSGRVSLQNSTGGFIDLMRWTCFRCGYTIFFDIDAARNCPFDGSADEEIFPE
jgi:rubrerythrin